MTLRREVPTSESSPQCGLALVPCEGAGTFLERRMCKVARSGARARGPDCACCNFQRKDPVHRGIVRSWLVTIVA